MSRWSVGFTRAAAKEVRGLEPVTRRRVLSAVAVLETDPQPRVLSEVDEAVLLVTVFRVAHRRAVDR